MWPVVSVSEVEDRWRLLSDAEKTVATARIADAEAEVQMKLRNYGITAPPEGDALWVKAYVRVVAEMVRRYLLNPESWLEETEKLDDYSATRRRDSAVSAGSLYVSDDEIASLLPFGWRRRGAFSIRLGTT